MIKATMDKVQCLQRENEGMRDSLNDLRDTCNQSERTEEEVLHSAAKLVRDTSAGYAAQCNRVVTDQITPIRCGDKLKCVNPQADNMPPLLTAFVDELGSEGRKKDSSIDKEDADKWSVSREAGVLVSYAHS